MLATFGQGKQPGSDKDDETVGIDYRFRRFPRSERQYIDVGVSYTHLRTNDGTPAACTPSACTRRSRWCRPKVANRGHTPAWAEPYFFVRALGPSYISENDLGERRQSRHFSFQAQVGVGVVLNPGGRRHTVLTVSWKHFSMPTSSAATTASTCRWCYRSARGFDGAAVLIRG